MKTLMLCILLMLTGCREASLVPVPPCEPQEEICNNYDDDCDGIVDEGTDRACSSACEAGVERCVRGSYTTCTARLGLNEVCNLIDDDCDGIVDNNMPIEPCYPYDTSQLQYGVCKFGINKCVNGAKACVGFVGPAPEICNRVDDNCDGVTDEGDRGPLDVIIVMDYSGSMQNLLSDLIRTMDTYITNHTNLSIMYGLVGAPSPDNMTTSDITLMQNVTTKQNFLSVLNANQFATGSGFEAQLDAIYQISLSSNPLNIDWTPGSHRAIIVFTDEYPQSYTGLTQLTSFNAANSNGIFVTIFSVMGAWDPSMWSLKPLVTGPEFSVHMDAALDMAACR